MPCWIAAGVVLTQVTDVLSEMLESGAQFFGVWWDFGGVHHEDHTVDLVFEAGLLYVASSLRANWLIWGKLQFRVGAGLSQRRSRRYLTGVSPSPRNIYVM